ncbi:MAG: 4-hydroxythreonine-4-phosphate dehydrogenase PdxA [Acidobacteriota bacterium]
MKQLAITLGDPAGIGPEIVLKSVESLSSPVRLYGSWDLTVQTPGIGTILDSFRRLQPGSVGTGQRREFVDVGDCQAFRFGEVSADCGRIALNSINAALDDLDSGLVRALVTAPINKKSIVAAGSSFHGHTELLAARSGLAEYGRDYAMFFHSQALRVVLLTVHVPLASAVGMVTARAVREIALLTVREYTRIYGAPPRMAVAGLNPHAGEGGLFGREEEAVLAGVEDARREGVEITGPFAADTLFRSAMRGSCDVVLALYHDQGLIPIKTVAFDCSVNVTIGLPYLRGSVDHGTAFDIAGKGIADPAPMKYAIDWTAAHAGAYAS